MENSLNGHVIAILFSLALILLTCLKISLKKLKKRLKLINSNIERVIPVNHGRNTDSSLVMSKTSTTKQALIREALAEGLNMNDFRRRWLILFTLCGSLLIVMLANSALNIALPSIAVDTEATSGELNWIVESYSLVFAGLLFTAGAVGDRFGRKKIMQIGLIIFILAAAYAAFIATTAFELILTRGVMGIGGAMVMPTTLSILNVTFPVSQRTKAVSIWGAVAGGGVLIGSIVSGFLLEHFEWESVFILCVAVGLVVLITNQLLTRESLDEAHTKIDWLGGALSFIGLSFLIYGMMESSHEEGFAQPSVWWGLGIGAVALISFVLWQRKTDHPMLDVSLFKDKRFTTASIAVTVAFFAMNGTMFVVGQLMQLILGYSPLESALALMPIVAPVVICAPLIPMVVRWVGEKFTLMIGLTILASGFLYAVFLWEVDVTYINVWIALSLTLTGMLFTSTPATNMILDNVPKNRSGMGSAMNDTTRELGAAAGVAILGSVMVSSYNSSVDSALKNVEGLPAEATETMKESLAYALETVKALITQGFPGIENLAQDFKEYWVEGLINGFGVGVWIIVGTLALVTIVLPWKKQDPTHIPDEYFTSEDKS